MVFGMRKRGAEPAVTEPAGSPNPAQDAIEAAAGQSRGVDADGFNVEAGVDQLRKFKAAHQWDYNLDVDQIEGMNNAVDSGDVEKEANFEHILLEEDSPYFEVRAAVRNYDE